MNCNLTPNKSAWAFSPRLEKGGEARVQHYSKLNRGTMSGYQGSGTAENSHYSTCFSD